MPKKTKAFRFSPQFYESFKELTSKKTAKQRLCLEKFISKFLEYGLVFLSAPKIENVEAEARVILAWLKYGKYWLNLGAKAIEI